MSKKTAQVIAAVIGVVLAVVVSIAVIAYTEAHQASIGQQRSENEIARIAARVFRNETAQERQMRIAGAATEAIISCRSNAECVTIGRDLFGPSRARLLAHAKKAVEDHCATLGGCKGERGPRGLQGPRGRQGPHGHRGTRGRQGPQGPQGIQGPQGLQGPAGAPGVTADQVIANLCARNSALVRLLCR